MSIQSRSQLAAHWLPARELSTVRTAGVGTIDFCKCVYMHMKKLDDRVLDREIEPTEFLLLATL
jgi:hypothetical protein